MRIGNREFDTNHHTYICGILNVTPDSFSDGGEYKALDRALFRTEEMIEEGMDILDIGGESTRPGHIPVSAEEEMDRVLPVLEAVRKRFSVPISLDTWKYEVAKEGIRIGADMINDIWGLQRDERMASLLADSKAVCCLMHNRKEAVYSNFMEDIIKDLREIIRKAKKAGINKDRIILDPGVGFGKDYHQNLLVINRMEELKKLGFPLLLGVSRKSVIGQTLGVEPLERLVGSLATGIVGIMKGCTFLRVHDIKAHVQAVKMVEAIREVGKGEKDTADEPDGSRLYGPDYN